MVKKNKFGRSQAVCYNLVCLYDQVKEHFKCYWSFLLRHVTFCDTFLRCLTPFFFWHSVTRLRDVRPLSNVTLCNYFLERRVFFEQTHLVKKNTIYLLLIISRLFLFGIAELHVIKILNLSDLFSCQVKIGFRAARSKVMKAKEKTLMPFRCFQSSFSLWTNYL